jgi:hypothetical protein
LEEEMTHQHVWNALLCSAAALALTACGGGGSSGTNFIPSPPVTTPTPAPTPTPVPPPIPAGPIGLQSTAPFRVVSAYATAAGELVAGPGGVQFTYSSADNRYTITLPGAQPGQLVTTGGSGSFQDGASTWLHLTGTSNSVTNGSADIIVSLDWPASSTFKYTSFGRWYDGSANPRGFFAYGIPTASGDVPLAGAATYAGSASGLTNDLAEVFGSVSLAFDFGAGTLSGVMKPAIVPIWDAIPLGDYTFRDTVYSAGATSFSGAFQVNGSTAPSSFQGSFNGPQATELMANWNAPYLNPLTNQWGTMVGAWTAKKP